MRRFAAILGGCAVVVSVAALAVVIVSWLGYLPYTPEPLPASGVLVIAAGADEKGAPSADLVMVLGRDGAVRALDVDRPGVVDGLAVTGRQALAYGGGKAVARAVSGQTGSATMIWVVLPPAVWHALLDSAQGVSLDVPAEVVAFDGSSVVRVDAGPRDLSGVEAGAVCAVSGMWPEADRSSAQRTVARSLGDALARDDFSAVHELMRTGSATSSIPGWASGFMGVMP